VTKIYYFSDDVALQYNTGKISPTSTNVKMILVWMPSTTSLQCNMAQVHMMKFEEQLKG
jgi:hypothetical protein